MWWRFIPISPIFIPLSRIKFKLKATGKENVPARGPFIIISNHQTEFDAFAIGLAIPKVIYRTRIVPWAKIEIRQGKEGKIGQYLYLWLRAIPIHREEEGEMEEAIRLSIEHLKRRDIIMVFPEGTRQKYGEVAPFMYGVANLARSVPCPILPVGVYSRREDRGMQVHFGEPFFMPDKKHMYDVLEGIEDKVEDTLSRDIDSLKQWSANVGRDRKGMNLIANLVRIISERISIENIDFDRFCRMAEEEDNNFLREKVIEVLPGEWKKTEELSEEDKKRNIRTSISSAFQKLDQRRAESGWHLPKRKKIEDKELLVQEMAKEEFEAVLDWAAEEGWNPGLHDGDCFYYTDPQGFLIGLLDGEPVAAVSGVSYDENFTFAGFFIVKKEFRNMGFGMTLGNELIERLGDHNVGIDAVVERQAFYTDHGFKTAYKTLRYQGIGQTIEKEYPSIKEIHKVKFRDLVTYDSKHFPARRDVFLRHWIDQPDSRGLVSVSHNKIKGYGLIRKCRSGYKIGPLFADNDNIAENLFDTLSSWAAGSTIYIDVPDVNRKGFDLVTNRGMELVFETVRMYNREIPELPMNKIFGNTSFELG